MPDISTPNLDYGNMVQAWDINDALMGGTLYMRQLGEAYLPRWPKENKEDYKKRLAVATLFDAGEGGNLPQVQRYRGRGELGDIRSMANLS